MVIKEKMVSRYGGYESNPLLAELYDFVPPYAGRADLAFYVELSRSAGGNTLELGCGTGRILIPTAVAGLDIVGLDASIHMLTRCRDKLRQQPADVQDRAQLVCGNIACFELKETFNLVTAPFRSFQHLLSVSDQLSCLHCVNRHLPLGGRFIFDVFQVDPRRIDNPAYIEESEEFPDVELPDGRKFRRSHRTAAFHRAEQYNDIELIYYLTDPGGRTSRVVDELRFRYFFRYEVEHLLARCGFKVVELFGNFDKSPLANDSPEMIFVAEKTSHT